MCIFLAAHITDCKLAEQDLSVPDLIKYWKYPVEEHEVKTSDGYYLSLHRIPHGISNQISQPNISRNCSKSSKRPVVFLQHGLLCSSSNWVENRPDNSLGFLLADAGYDVWMGNVRGNTYSSSKHESLSVDSEDYWDFSFHEMAKFDLPAMINYTLEITGEKQLYYVGHSQGSMMIFAGLPGNEELQRKIKKVVALAPVSRLKHIHSAIRNIAKLRHIIGFSFHFLQQRSFLPSSRVVKTLAREICGRKEKQLCEMILSAANGYGTKNLNTTRLPIYFSHAPAGTSVKNMKHFGQLISSGGFNAYDYGWFGNLASFASFLPPSYRLSTIQTPMHFIYGSHDWLAHHLDVKWTASQIVNLEGLYEVEGYNHLDFLWATSAKRLVYSRVIDIFNKNENC